MAGKVAHCLVEVVRWMYVGEIDFAWAGSGSGSSGAGWKNGRCAATGRCRYGGRGPARIGIVFGERPPGCAIGIPIVADGPYIGGGDSVHTQEVIGDCSGVR